MESKYGFTLVELIVGITISMLLMMSVGIFVATGMNNIKLQKDVIDDTLDITAGMLHFQKLLSSSEKVIDKVSSGFLLKINPEFDNGTYSYIGNKTVSGEYCSTGATTDFNHMYSSSFVPFEEIGEDINTNFLQTQTSSGVTIAGEVYRTDIKQHGVFKQNGTDWERIIGKEIYGNKLLQGSVGTGVFLNSPTGLVGIDGKIVFSDTLNNRILYSSGGLIYSLLDENDGLSQPTGLAYNNTTKELFIANSGAGEILSFSSVSVSTNPNLNIVFTPDYDFTANNFTVLVQTGAINLTGSEDISHYTIDSYARDLDNIAIASGNSLNYYFSESYQTESLQSTCVNLGETIVNASPLSVIKCSSTKSGTGQVANISTHNFVSGVLDSINISNITPDLTDAQNYYVELVMKNGDSEVYKKIAPYFTQGDDDIFTKDDNTLRVLTGGLNYPTGIQIDTAPAALEVNVFEDRENIRLNSSGNVIGTQTNLMGFTQEQFDDDYRTDYLMHNPINSFSYVEGGDNLLHARLDYYKYLNCYSNNEKVERTFLLKKAY